MMRITLAPRLTLCRLSSIATTQMHSASVTVTALRSSCSLMRIMRYGCVVLKVLRAQSRSLYLVLSIMVSPSSQKSSLHGRAFAGVNDL